MLKLKNVSFSLKEMSRSILQDINYTVQRGKFVVILGANGSGKSSIIKLINGSNPLTQGKIEFNGKELKSLSTQQFAQNVVTLAQEASQSLFYDLTVLENCVLWESRFPYPGTKLSLRSERKFYAKYLQDFHASLNDRLDIKIERLSGGERQALLLALCSRIPPQLLLLDEHTSALDPHQARIMMACTERLVREHEITTLMTTHNLEHALQYGDQLIAIKEGKIVFSAEKAEKKKLTRDDLLKICY